jgi:mono/diheme cytochrome c family protein
VIKLISAHIEEMRGIRKLDIDFRKGNFAISGPNGSGKSGVIDAIEFALTGQISRLTGTGTKGLTIAEHGPHVDKTKFPDAAFVELKVFLPTIGKTATITRKVSSPKKPKIAPADKEIKEVFAEIHRMKPYSRSIFDLFDGKRRYEVPLFQRQYVWNLDDHWQPLWEDIERKFVQRLNRSPSMIGLAVTLAFSLVAFTMPTSVWAAGPTLTVSADGRVHTFDRDELLARTDVVEITTSRDVAYRTPRTYRAVALAKLLEGVAIPPDAVVEAAAQDGFVTQLPRDLVYANDDIVAYMAIEVADTPWPPIPGKDKSAGPFYIVWLGDQASSVPIMKWPYQVVSLSVQDAPAKRWPSLAVDPRLPALHPARDGQTIFVNKCFTCHTMNGAGSASAGPDLNLPMNPTEYFTDAGLRALIRDPRSVRVWPEQRMPGFAEENLSDEELGLILAYLSHMADRKSRATEGGSSKR